MMSSVIVGHSQLQLFSMSRADPCLQSLFKEVKTMPPKNVKKVIRIIKVLEDEKKEG